MPTLAEIFEEELERRRAEGGRPEPARPEPARPEPAKPPPETPPPSPGRTLGERLAEMAQARRAPAPQPPPPEPARAGAPTLPPESPREVPRRARLLRNVGEPFRHVGEGGPVPEYQRVPIGEAVRAAITGPAGAIAAGLGFEPAAPGARAAALQNIQEGLRQRRQEGGTYGTLAAFPEAAMRAINVPAEAAERGMGLAQQAAGPVALQPPFLGVAAPRRQIARAEALAERLGAPRGAITERVPEEVRLPILGPRPLRPTEEMVEEMRQPGAIEEAVRERSLEPLRALAQPAAFQAGMFTYEGPEYVRTARQRIESGENPDTVVQEVAASLGGGAHARDLAGQMVFDPLDVVSWLGRLGRVRGWSKAAVLDNALARSTDEGAEIIAGLGKVEQGILAHTPEAQVAHLTDKAYNTLHDVFQAIPEDAPVNKLDVLRALVERGDDADEIFEAAGLGARAIDPAEALRLGVPEGAMLSVPNSKAAWESTALLREVAGDAKQQKALLESFETARSGYTAALTGRRGVVGIPTATLDEADDAMVKFLNRLDEGARAVLGVEKRQPPKALAAWQGLQGIFATYFHMGYSPGYAIRNKVQNMVIATADGLDMVTPTRRVDEWLVGKGFLPRGVTREVGAGVAPSVVRGKGFLGVRPFAFDLSRRAESAASRRAVYTGIRETFAREWALGRAIPGGAYDTLARVVGPDKAEYVLARAQGVWTVEELRDIIRSLDAPAILDPTLIAEARRFDVLDEMGDAVRAGEDVVAQADEGVTVASDALRTQPLYRQGSYEAGVQALARDELLRRGVSDKVVDRYLGEMPSRFQAGSTDRANLFHAIEAQLKASGDNGLEFQKLISDAKEEFFDPAFDLRNELYPQAAAGRVPWDEAMLRVDEAFQAAHQGWMGRLSEYAAQIGAEVPPLPEGMAYVPLSQVPQFRMAQLTSAAAEAGVPTASITGAPQDAHLINLLKKEGVLPADFKGKLLTPEAIGKLDVETFDAAMDVLRARAKPLKEIAEEAVEIAPVIADPAPVAADVAGHNLALAHERAALARRVAGSATRPPVEKWTPEEIAAVRAFVSDLEPRLAGVRTVGQHVGEEMRDFAFFNYADKRNFDAALGVMFAYPYWHTRNMAHNLRRAFEQPGFLAALLRTRMKLREINADLPDWWKDQIKVADFAGQDFYIPIMGILDPLNGFVGDKFRDPEQRETPAGVVLNELGNWGPSLHVGISEAMAFAAHMQGDEDQARAWLTYFGGPTRALNAASVLAREHLGMEDAIPPGGVGAEWYFWDNGRFVGSKWDARRIGKALAEMAQEGEITPEQALDAAYTMEGDIYDQALQRSRVRTAGAVLMAWALGPSLKPRPESEIEVAEMDAERRALYAARETMDPEQYRLAWADFRRKYDWADAVIMFRRDTAMRDETYSWGVINRLPPSNRTYFEAAGIDPILLDRFYDEKGLEKFTDDERAAWMTGMRVMGTALALPSDATGQEWDEARARKRAVDERLKMEYGEEIFSLMDAYFALETNEEKTAFLEGHPMLEDAWNTRDKLVTGDPLLLAYYGSIEKVEQAMAEEFYSQWPENMGEMWDTYFRLKESDPDAAAQFWADNPVLEQYSTGKRDYVLARRGELEKVSAFIKAMEPEFARLREDFVPARGREQDLAAMVASRAALADFEIDPELRGDEIKAMLDLQVDRVPEGQMGALLRALRGAGGLDATLKDYWATGRMGVREEALETNRVEMLALIAAIETIADQQNWEPAPALVAATGTPAKPTAAQVDAAETFITDLHQKSPTFYTLLRRYVKENTTARRRTRSRSPGFARMVASIEGYIPAIRMAFSRRGRGGGRGGSETRRPRYPRLPRGRRSMYKMGKRRTRYGGRTVRRTRWSSRYL